MLNFFIPTIHRQGSPYSKAHFFDVYNKEHQLLTPAEMEELSHHDMDNSGQCEASGTLVISFMSWWSYALGARKMSLRQERLDIWIVIKRS